MVCIPKPSASCLLSKLKNYSIIDFEKFNLSKFDLISGFWIQDFGYHKVPGVAHDDPAGGKETEAVNAAEIVVG